MFPIVSGVAMGQAAAGGGGGTPSVSVATSASGNYDNAVKIGITSGTAGVFDFSNGIKDGSNSSFGTASSPTRTTQSIPVRASDYLAAWNAGGTGNTFLVIGGYIRSNNFTTANKEAWDVLSGAIVSQSFSSGVTVSTIPTDTTYQQVRDNSSLSAYGIYNNLNYVSGSNYHFIVITHASGRGASTLPQVGDNFTFRLEVHDQDASTTYTAIHDVTVNFT